MKIAIYFTLFLCLTVSCNFSSKQNVSVKQLTDSATLMTKHYSDTTKFIDALSLFNQAVSMDSNDFNAWSKKYFLEFSLGQSREAEQSLKKLIKFKPDSAELYAHAGFFLEFRHDTIESKKVFEKAVSLYKATLDTMDMSNPYWMYDWKMSAICNIMAGREKIIQDFLKENCKTPLDSSFYNVETLTKTKEELLQSIRAIYIR